MKKILLLGVVVMLFGLYGCSISITEENTDEMYSRANTSYICESAFFGKGRSDDIYVALNFIYSNKSIEDKHGSSFEITADDITCHTSESKSCFFLWVCEGKAEYSFVIDNYRYRIKLSKKAFEAWRVVECYFE